MNNVGEIRRVIQEEAEAAGVKVSKILLFGSQARGNADRESDWDLLVVVKGELEWSKRRELFAKISLRLAQLRIPADLLIRTEAEVEQAQNEVFPIVKVAFREGVDL